MSISALNAQDVHRITSGQVIIDMPTILKELIENSLDAHATSIEINFNNYGLDSIEFVDNGDGIDFKDFAQLCQNHATSKLSSFEDLSKISTLGFRGEALSSLCSISTLKVTTTSAPPKASILEFSKTGELVKQTICSRKKGTTIFVTNIFDDLPVRKKDLTKNIKREFSKTLSLISNYILISSSVKFSVNNVTKTGKRQNVLKSQGSLKIQDNILNVFGSNSLFGLLPIDLTIDLNNQKHKLRVATDVELDYKFRIEGLISKSSFGYGRSAHDRQFWFLNKRPVNLGKFSKTVNEVYKTFNHLEYPSFFLNFVINQDFLDLNVTPDKRTVLLHNESEVLEELRLRLIEFFDGLDLSVPKNDFQRGVDSFMKPKKEQVHEEYTDEDRDLHEEDWAEDEERHGENVDYRIDDKDPEDDENGHGDITDEGLSAKRVSSEQSSDPRKKRRVEEPLFVDADDDHELEKPASFNQDSAIEEAEEIGEEQGFESDLEEIEVVKPRPVIRSNEKVQSILSTKRITNISRLSSFKHLSDSPPRQRTTEPETEKVTLNIGDEEIVQEAFVKNSKLSFKKCHCGQDASSQHNHTELTEENDSCDEAEEDVTRVDTHFSRKQYTDYDDIAVIHSQPIKPLKEDVINYETTVAMPSTFSKILSKKVKTEISEAGEIELDRIEDKDASEKLLTLTVAKRDFSQMKIIGQFNLGFILVIRENKDLFIVDQHASDEKYNFEDLQKHTVFDSQRLIQPKTIELNTMDELIVLENLDIFTKNGFKVEIDEESKPGFKVRLKSLPISKKTVFDISDFSELIYRIRENPNNPSVRCSKIRSMFAMRSCRKSIMIGQTLSMNTMTKVIRNLGTLEKPWNCPHGRPTMRHLLELKQWEPFSEDHDI